MKPNNKDNITEPNNLNGMYSLKKHNERWRRVHKCRLNAAMNIGPEDEELAFLKSSRPLQIRCPMIEIGGLQLPNSTMDWSVLVPVLKIAKYKLSQN